MKGLVTCIVAALCCLSVSAVSCRPDATGTETDLAGNTVRVSQGNLIVSVSGNGTIAVSKETDIAFDKGGKVSGIYVSEGDRVVSSQVVALLIPLEEGSLELAVAQAEAALAQAEYDLDEAENPYTGEDIEEAEQAIEDAEDRFDIADDMLGYVLKHGSDWEVLQWKMEVLNAEIQLQMAEDNLEDMLNDRDEDRIYVLKKQVAAAEKSLEEALARLESETLVAPFDGIVSSVYIDEGKVVPSPGVSQVPVIQLIDPTSMEFIISLDEIDIPGIMIGDSANVTVDAFPETVFEGRVISITPLPVVEAGLVSYDVKIAFSIPRDMDIRVGMSATADIVKNKRENVLIIPNNAIFTDSEGNQAVRVTFETANGFDTEERMITTGISNGLYTEVTSGIQEGELIAIDKIVP